ncbi:MAG: T9SS type A sorting domain-containing protein [Calditrichia bacterium]
MSFLNRPIGLLLAFCLLFSLTQTAMADYTISGNLKYEDLEMDFNSGFTGTRNDRPVRYADLAVIVNGFVISTGSTDENGDYSFLVSSLGVQDMQLVAITTATENPDYNVQVVTFVNGGGIGSPHALQIYTENGHDPNTDINVGEVVAEYHNGGDEFNLFDLTIDATDYLVNVLGEPSPPGSPSLLTCEFTFNPNGTGFAFFNGVSVNLDGAYGYDDCIMLHEIGHWVQNRFGNFSDNTGGQHFIGDQKQDPRLSFGEGWPTFWGSHVRLHNFETTGNTSAYRQPSMYMNSNGSINGGQGFSYDLEAQAGRGAASENVVQAMMWDMVDNENTPDFSPGTDDEDASYAMDRTFPETWDFVTSQLSQPPFSGVLTYEDWSDLWIATVPNPESDRLRGLEQNLHRIEYVEDAFEPNDTRAEATLIGNNEFRVLTHHTTYPEGDLDIFRIDAIEGVEYTAETSNLFDGADNYMRVYDAAGTELASHDNIGTVGGPPNALENLRSRIAFTAPDSADYYFEISRSIFNSNNGGGSVSKYGNWDIRFSISDVPATFPMIAALPGNLSVLITDGQPFARTLQIFNQGTQLPLDYSIVEYDQENDVVTDFSWVSASPTTGSVAGGDVDAITVTFDPAEFVADTVLNKRLRIQSNDLLQPNRDVLLIVRIQVPVGVEPEPGSGVPASFALEQNYPNPFNPETTIRYAVPEAGRVVVAVYNTLGQRVRTLVDEQHSIGSYRAVWNGRNDQGASLASGVYLYKMTSGSFTATRKLMLLK